MLEQLGWTVLTESATQRGSNKSVGRGQRANAAIRGQLRAFRAQVMQRYKIECWSGPLWILNPFQRQGDGRTAWSTTAIMYM